jgi:hypothetical protein
MPRFSTARRSPSAARCNLQEGVSKAGKGYYTFDLSDGAEAVHVFATGKARCKAGRATVDGTFDGVGRQIISSRVRCR